MYTDPGTSLTTTVKHARLKRFGVKRLSRAHLALAARPQLAQRATEALEAVRAALQEQLACPVAMQARTVQVSVNPFGSLARGSAFVLLDLSALGTRAVLEIELPLLCAALERMSGGPGRLAAASRLTRIEEAAFAYLCLVGLAALRGLDEFHRRFGARLLSVHLDRAEILERTDCRRRHVAFEVATTVGNASGVIRLLVPALPLQSCVQDLEPSCPQTLAPEVLAAGLTARAFAGRATLGALEVQHLAPGDVVMFDRLRLDGGGVRGPGRLSTRGFELHGAFESGGFVFSRADTRAFPKEQQMASASDSADDTQRSLPVDVEIELTRVRLSLGELALLKPGAVLPLHINASESVLLRIGDRGIARAELVDIEGEVGARILTLLS